MLPETLVNEVIKQICKSFASFDLKVRNKGFKRLTRVIALCNTGTYNLEYDHCLLIWKGLHYWLWSQDKLLNQERLVREICNLFSSIKDKKVKLDFIAAFFQTEVREWRTLDKWRTDKFMMLFRQFFRQSLTYLSEDGWSQLDAFLEIFRKNIACGDHFDPAFGLRLHFVSIYLEEISRHDLNGELYLKFLKPYFDLVPQLARDNPMLKRIEDMFFLILPPTDDEEEEPLDINYKSLGLYFYQLGGTGGKNVRKVYEWATICFGIVGESLPTDVPSAISSNAQNEDCSDGHTNTVPETKRKRKLNAVPVGNAKPKPPLDEVQSPPRKKRKMADVGASQDSSPSRLPKRKKTLTTSPSPTGGKKAKSSTTPPSPKGAKAKAPHASVSPAAAKTRTHSFVNADKAVKAQVPTPSPVGMKTPNKSLNTPITTPDTAGKDKRVSFGKIYRKPFKKKDAVKTPSPGTITSSAAGKGILKKKMLRQSKKLAILIR